MTDAGTFSFGDLGSGRFGLAVAAGDVHAWFLSVDGAEVALSDLVSPPLEAVEVEPERRWRLTLAGGDTGFDLEFAALADPVSFADGRDWLCRVIGTVTAGGAAEPIDCLGQRTVAGGAPPQGTLVRRIGAWLGEDQAILARAERANGAEADGDALSVFLVEGEPPFAVPVADPRLSTQYDADGRHVRAGLELWVAEEDDYAHRAGGEVLGRATLTSGAQRMDCAFMRWRMHGREGAGIYDILRRA